MCSGKKGKMVTKNLQTNETIKFLFGEMNSLRENTYQTFCGTIHYWSSILSKDAITLIFLPGLTADHRLFDKQEKIFNKRRCVEMRGFRIKFRSEEIVVTPDFRSSVTIFYSSSNGYELSVAGIKGFGDDALDTFWIKSDMHIGESIEIEIINADEQVCSSPTCVKKLDPNPLKLSEKQKQQMLDEYLKDFYLLEAQLKKKGVL